MGAKRWRDYGFVVGDLQTGKNNLITDVPGILVGHSTLNQGPVKTGVTVLLPHQENLFQEKVLSASYVFNGFGKTTGLMQIDELGTIETPIALTNTLSVGTVYQALVEYMMKDNLEIGEREGTVNPIVCECNDGYLNDIRGLHVTREHVFQALSLAAVHFEEGGIGAGTGMCTFGFKGGIGSSSRLVEIEDTIFTLGALVLSNFGRRSELILNGKRVGLDMELEMKRKEGEGSGSIIMVLATDIPLSCRQLKRVAKRAGVGLIRTGSFIDNGSGDLAIVFSTTNRILHKPKMPFYTHQEIAESYLNLLFRAAAEATEEAILNSLITAEGSVGRKGHYLVSLQEYLHLLSGCL